MVGLDRRLGPLDGAAIVVSNVIGGGIFLVPAFVAQSVTHPWAMLAVWASGGALAFAGAMAYAELSALRPRAGGEYVYLREAFGPLAGFLTGWTSFVAGFSGAIAASAVGLTSYLSRFVPAAGDATPFFTLPLGPFRMVGSPQAVAAIAVIVLLSVVHILGLGPGRIVQNLLAGAKVAVLVAFVALGFGVGQGDLAHFAAGGLVSPALWVLALIPVMFSYSGWNAAAYVAEEMRDPGRNVPLALGLGTIVVVAIYLLLNALYVYALPVAEFATIDVRVVDAAADRLFGDHDRGQYQRDGDGRTARLLRHGSRRAVPRIRGAGPSEISHPLAGDRGAGGLGQPPRAVRALRSARRVHRFCRRAVCRHRGRVVVRTASPVSG